VAAAALCRAYPGNVTGEHPDPASRPVADPLLPRIVAAVWFAALLLFATGLVVGGILGPAAAVPGTSTLSLGAVLLGVTGQGLMYARRGYDALDRLQRRATASIALASALATGGIVGLIVFGPDRPIGPITAVAAVAVMAAAASAAAATSVLIRPHVEAMPAHVWAGIGGSGLAVPFMVAGVDPALIVAVGVGLATYDRMRGRRIHRDLERRRALSASIDERGIPVRGLPGSPVVETSRPRLPWSRRERRLSLTLGVAALLTVLGAWVGGVLVADAVPGLVSSGQGLAIVTLGVVPLFAQVAVLLRITDRAPRVVAAASAIIVASSAAVLLTPSESVALVAWALQSVAAGTVVASFTRMLVPGTALGAAAIVVTSAILWWVVVVTSWGIALAFAAVFTILLALRRRRSDGDLPARAPAPAE
jgi:hypothetical protein